jgi:hypothetical protein
VGGVLAASGPDGQARAGPEDIGSASAGTGLSDCSQIPSNSHPSGLVSDRE